MGVGRLKITPWPKTKRVQKQSPVALRETHTSSTKIGNKGEKVVVRCGFTVSGHLFLLRNNSFDKKNVYILAIIYNLKGTKPRMSQPLINHDHKIGLKTGLKIRLK